MSTKHTWMVHHLVRWSITFPADGKVLHHTLSVVVHHLGQIVHGWDSVVADTRQHYACTDYQENVFSSHLK